MSRAPPCSSSLCPPPSSPSPLRVSARVHLPPFVLEQHSHDEHAHVRDRESAHVRDRVHDHESVRDRGRDHESGRGRVRDRGRDHGRDHESGRDRGRDRAPLPAGWPQRSTCLLHGTSSPESHGSAHGGHPRRVSGRGGGDGGRGYVHGHHGNGCEQWLNGMLTTVLQMLPMSMPADVHSPY